MNPKIDDGTLARMDALRILQRWMDTEEFPDRMFGEIPPFRRGFVMDLVYTAVRNVRAAAFVIDPFLRSPVTRPYIYAALLLGATQLLFMKDVAEYAGVSATVEAVKQLVHPSQGALVNAVLRNLLREKDAIEKKLSEAPMAVRLSHSDEQVERWTKAFGAQRTQELCEWDNRPADVTILSLPGRPSIREIAVAFEQEAGVHTHPHSGFPSRALCLPHGSHIDRLPGFAEGLFSIQDPATLEAVRLLQLQPGQRVLDACAAPGGKTVQIAALLKNEGHIIAMDCWRDRIQPLRENLKRMRFESMVSVRVGDAKRITLSDVGGRKFDRILADVPCSNTGVQRRRADARWRFSADRLAELTKTQRAILQNLSGLLAPGGILVYSTCSIEREEDQDVVQDFLRSNPGFTLLSESFQIPPDRACDGAYAAAIQSPLHEPIPKGVLPC